MFISFGTTSLEIQTHMRTQLQPQAQAPVLRWGPETPLGQRRYWTQEALLCDTKTVTL
jgi:hypothetical protein